MKMIDTIGDWTFRHRDKIPLPFISIALVGLVIYTPDFFLERNWLRYSVYAAGFLFVIIGEFFRLWAVGHAGFITHSRSKKLRAEKLVVTGPYAIVRNPIYLGNFLLGMGFVLLTLTWWLFVLYLVFFSLEYGLIIHAEERFLQDKFGNEFNKYVESVPMILPRLSDLSELRFGDFHLNYLYPERWTLFNMALAGILLILINYLRG